MKKQQAISLFNDEWDCYIQFRAPNLSGDICAKREAFVQFIDQLHRDGEITDKQVVSWENPF